MAINPVIRAALKALSYPDIDLRENYQLVRNFQNATKYPYFRKFYNVWDHVVLSGDYNIPVRLFLPGKGEPERVLLFFHGGGWVTGNIDSYTRVCSKMAQITQSQVLSVDYRLAPEHRFPTGLEDCYNVAKEVFLNKEVDLNDVTLIGDSAGANLAAAVSLLARDRGEFLPGRQILLYPATYNDHSITSPFASIRENGEGYLMTSKRICEYMELYRGSREDLLNPYFAPLVSENLSHQPDTLIVTAEYDPLRDEGEAYGKKLEAAGNKALVHRMADALHGFLSLPPSFTPVKNTYAIINDFLKGESEHGENQPLEPAR